MRRLFSLIASLAFLSAVIGCPMGGGIRTEGTPPPAPTGIVPAEPPVANPATGAAATQDATNTDTNEKSTGDGASGGSTPQDSPITVGGSPQGVSPKPNVCKRAVPGMDHLQANLMTPDWGIFSDVIAVRAEGDLHPGGHDAPVRISTPQVPSAQPFVSMTDAYGHFIADITGAEGKIVRFEADLCGIHLCQQLTLNNRPGEMAFISCPDVPNGGPVEPIVNPPPTNRAEE